MSVLQYLFAVRGTPQYIRSDNGLEFVVQTVRHCLQQADVGTLFIPKGISWENGYVESGGGKLRDETFEPRVVLELSGSLLGDRPLATGLKPSPHPQCIGLSDPRRVCGRQCSSSFSYASASRTHPSYLTPILSLRLVQIRGGGQFSFAVLRHFVPLCILPTPRFHAAWIRYERNNPAFYYRFKTEFFHRNHSVTLARQLIVISNLPLGQRN